jgi:hypothetical protein
VVEAGCLTRHQPGEEAKTAHCRDKVGSISKDARKTGLIGKTPMEVFGKKGKTGKTHSLFIFMRYNRIC